jgi:hypothetical protein
LGKPDQTYIIGKRWVKKNIPKTKRIAKPLHENSELGDIYDIGKHYIPDSPTERINLWVCMDTGTILKSSPKLKAVPVPKVKKAISKPKIVPQPSKVKKPVEIQPKPDLKPEPEPIVTSKPKIIPKKPSATTLTSVSEVKGIGKAAYEKLSAANVNTIGDLISKHSQEIATLIGRKSDAQVKKWQDNAREMLK